MAYRIWNGPAPTTAALASVSTGTTIKTMLQVATASTQQARVIGWGFTLDDPPGADAVIELLETDVAASAGTAHVASGLVKMDPNAVTPLLQLGTALTGYSFGTEGATTTSRVFDAVSLSSVSGESPLDYRCVFMPDARPIVAVSKFLRIRATTPTTAVDMRCYIDLEGLG
jgi:hypothetical protein